MSVRFAEIEEDYLRIVTASGYCIATTVDTPLDGAHGAQDAPPRGQPGRQRAAARLGRRGRRGWGPQRIFTPLRLEPWRLQVMRGEEYPYGDLTGRVRRA